MPGVAFRTGSDRLTRNHGGNIFCRFCSRLYFSKKSFFFLLQCLFFFLICSFVLCYELVPRCNRLFSLLPWQNSVGTRAATVDIAAQKFKNKVAPYVAIQAQIQSSVTKWHDEIICKDFGRVKKCKQMLKKKFVKLNQLACANPVAQKKLWRKDLEKAGKETIAVLCPDWQNDPAHRSIYEMISKDMNLKKCPRRDWLQETACTWLESGEFRNADWYPNEAIRVAHQIFLRGTNKLPTFIKNLRKKKSPIISSLIEAWEATQGRPCMAFASIAKSFVLAHAFVCVTYRPGIIMVFLFLLICSCYRPAWSCRR